MKEMVQYTDITDNEVEFYREMGYLCLPGFVDTEVLDGLREDVLVSLESKGVDRSTLSATDGSAGKLQQCHTYYKDSALDGLINSPRTLHVAGRLLGGPAIRYLPFTAVKAGGGGQFHLHQDNNYTRHEPASGSLNIWVAMVDMTPENGCLQMIPRSHLDGTLASENAGDGDGHKKVSKEPSGVIPIRMRAGDAVAFQIGEQRFSETVKILSMSRFSLKSQRELRFLSEKKR